MSDEAQEKKHAATGKRLTELRRRGTVLRSRDMSGGMVFLVAVGVFLFTAAQFKAQFMENFTDAFTGIRHVQEHQEFLAFFVHKLLIENIKLLLPVFLLALLTVFLSPFLFGGWNFTLETLQFNLGKISPLNNLKRMFSPIQASIEILRSMFKCLVIMSVLILFIYNNREEIYDLPNYPVQVGMEMGCLMLRSFVIYLSLSLVLIVASDVLYHYLQFQKQTKMTSQEIKDEHKETEGNVEVKRKMRGKQLMMLKHRLSKTVPQATVIITNPSHYAVALRYENKKDNAPKVVAKGKDEIAQQIRYLAITNAIPIYEAPPLARAIYHTTHIGAEIHPDLYMAVAIVLSYVHQLKNYQLGMGQAPQFVSQFELPKEFIYEE